MKIANSLKLKGTIQVPGDKSISHRSIMMGAIAEGKTEIRGFLPGTDCLSTISCFRQMGIDIEQNGDRVRIAGKGMEGLKKPQRPLDCGNSGTTLRLMAGILAGSSFESVLDGDDSIRRRPMARIIRPLTEMGALIDSFEGKGLAPLRIKGHSLKGIEYDSPVASAQVKS